MDSLTLVKLVLRVFKHKRKAAVRKLQAAKEELEEQLDRFMKTMEMQPEANGSSQSWNEIENAVSEWENHLFGFEEVRKDAVFTIKNGLAKAEFERK